MQSNPDWRVHLFFDDPTKGVSISFKHVLFWLAKALFVLALNFSFLYGYVYLTFSNEDGLLFKWAVQLYDWNSWVSQDRPPFYRELASLLPALGALLILSIIMGIAVNLIFRKHVLRYEKKQRRNGILITAGILVAGLLFNHLFIWKLMELSTVPARLLPQVYINGQFELFISNMPGRFTLYFSLLFALTYHLVKLCTMNLRRKPKAGAEATKPAQMSAL